MSKRIGENENETEIGGVSTFASQAAKEINTSKLLPVYGIFLMQSIYFYQDSWDILIVFKIQELLFVY